MRADRGRCPDVEVWFLGGHGPEVTRLLAPVASDGVRARGVWLLSSGDQILMRS